MIFTLTVILSSCKNNDKEQENNALTAEETFSKKDEDPIQRYGELLEDVQMQHIFADGKTFVDSDPKHPADSILKWYKEAKKQSDVKVNIREFVTENFELPDTPTSNFHSDTTRTVAEHINALWPYLKRDADEGETGSRIDLPNPYIVPGGRFREVYYWDSYFILLGLKEAGEVKLIENILDNFTYQIETLGFIPNGNRTYYKGRSQPPFFAEMVNLLESTQSDTTVYSRYVDALEKEYDFWMKGVDSLASGNQAARVVKLDDGSVLNRYYSNTRTPRAESYREDILTAQEAKGRTPEDVYLNISAACESGWDFSSRWFADPNNLETIKTTRIIPVDLNALMYNLEVTLAKAYTSTGEERKAQKMTDAASARRLAINRYLWDTKEKIYKDHDLDKAGFTDVKSLAMVYPLYFNLATDEQAAGVAAALKKDFLKPGGLVTTLNDNGQQWDSPNGWPPHQWLAVRGLEKHGLDNLAEDIKTRWLRLNEQVYKRTGKMLEKYNVTDTTLVAGGGEYPTQDGFGWTNGVYMDLKEN
ncbi:MAG: trehalase [Cytophagaceae bacterium]|nr:trehalase [Cytophagaceae bacterium]